MSLIHQPSGRRRGQAAFLGPETPSLTVAPHDPTSDQSRSRPRRTPCRLPCPEDMNEWHRRGRNGSDGTFAAGPESLLPEAEPRHVGREHRPGERLDRASAPRARPRPSSLARPRSLRRLGTWRSPRGSAPRAAGAGATSSRATPSTMTTSLPDSTLTASCGLARRLRCQRVGPPSTYQRSSTHAPQIGIMCGAASAPAVAIQ